MLPLSKIQNCWELFITLWLKILQISFPPSYDTINILVLCSCYWPSWNIILHIYTIKWQQFLQAFNQYNALLYLVHNFISVLEMLISRYVILQDGQGNSTQWPNLGIMTVHLNGTETNINSPTLRVLHFPWCLQTDAVKLQVRPPFHLHQSWFINYSNLYHSPFHNTNRWFT